ncbi:hypothetical protein [Dokdonia sp.]|uniref:hypothetical protein n=1 Tax=Dokdonia sp. TaxID=2024995 RepID=UPI003265DABA
MKTILITLFLVCNITIAFSQTTMITIGSRTGCTGRGICTITNTPDTDNKTVNTNNASFIHIKEGTTVLRIYRNKLTQDEQDRVLGTSITSKNKDSLQFIMEEALSLSEQVTAIISITRSKQITELEAKTYPTIITEDYIDITIIEPNTKE